MSVVAVVSVVKALKVQLEEFRKSKPGLSVRAIAKSSNVNRYFLHKILDEPAEKVTNLDFTQVLLLSKFLTNSTNIRDTIDQSTEEIRDLLLSTFNVDYSASFAQKKCCTFTDVNLEDFDIFIILLLASCNHVSLDVVKKALNEKAWEKIAYLESLGKISVLENGRVVTADGSFLHIPSDIRIRHLPEILRRYFSPSNFGKQRCFHGLFYQSINADALKKVHKLHLEFATKLNDLMDSEESKGSIPIFSGICLDSFVSIDQMELNEE
ncbi:MAG: hypothetical protein HRU09_19825 [Oligoflexales bacterium]|nr:hypothetical protein [Oligoflexales bacterium]